MAKKSPDALIEPKLLTWARETSGYTIDEISSKLKVDPEKVRSWEKGAEKLTIRALERLARHYKRPLSAFFLPKPPQEPGPPKDLRTFPGEVKTPFSTKALLAIRRARWLQSLYSDIEQSLKLPEPEPLPKINRNADPEFEASRVRDLVEITLKTQLQWQDIRMAYREWARLLENKGILVLQTNIPKDEARGFSLVDGNNPAIVVNSNDTVSARIFTLFHEFAHILLKDEGICDWQRTYFERQEELGIEKFCNHFSGAFLVPKERLIEETWRYSPTDNWPDPLINKLARTFKVSPEVIVRRLTILNLASKEFYEKKREEFKDKYAELEKAAELKRKKPRTGEFRRNYARDCVSENGVKLVSLVLEIYKQGIISSNEVSDFLSVRPKHIPRIQEIIQSKTQSSRKFK